MQANFITCSKGAKVQSVRITELTGQISAKTDKHTEFSSTGTDAWSPLPLMTAPNVKPVLQFLHLQLCPLGSKWHKFVLITRTSLSRHYTTLYTAQAQYSVSRHMPRRLEKKWNKNNCSSMVSAAVSVCATIKILPLQTSISSHLLGFYKHFHNYVVCSSSTIERFQGLHFCEVIWRKKCMQPLFGAMIVGVLKDKNPYCECIKTMTHYKVTFIIVIAFHCKEF